MIRACVTVLALLAAALPAVAAEPEAIDTYRDWTAYRVKERGGLACYMASQPTDSEPKNVRRGEIWALVTHRPYQDIANEVSVYIGYPLKENSTVEVEIDGRKFELFTHEDTAWARTPEDDKAIVEAMRKGLKMAVRGSSQRGTETNDQFSLSGFTAAHEAIGRACKVK